MIATCGHEVEEGISCFIHSFTKEGKPCLNYGTYCTKCFLEYYNEGRVHNKELHLLIQAINKDFAKENK